MDLLVIAIIFICTFSSIITLLNENVKATIMLLLPVPVLGVYSQHLGIGGMYQFIALICTGLMIFEMLLIWQLCTEKKCEGLFFLNAIGYIAALYACHSIAGLGIRQSILLGSSYYVYLSSLCVLLVSKHNVPSLRKLFH